MELENNVIQAMYELFSRAKDMYGDKVESFWFYENETCPCCNKRSIDKINTGEESALVSLNSFMYHDLNILIVYFLCSHCITDLPVIGKVKQKNMYNSIEQNLKNSYHKYLESLAS